MTRITIIAILVTSLAGCVGDRNSACEWPAKHPEQPLDDSLRMAKDLAIRYADAQGKRDSWRSEREACEARLFQTIANHHNSTLAEIAGVRQGFGRRVPDLPVYGPMLALCVLAAWWLVQASTTVVRQLNGPSKQRN